MRSRVGKSECSESEAFVGTRGRRADGETFDSEREGGFRGRLQGGASGGKPQVSHNRPLACPARRAQGIITEGIEPSGKTLEGPPGCPRRFCFSCPPGGPGAQKRNKLGKTENPGQMREGRLLFFCRILGTSQRRDLASPGRGRLNLSSDEKRLPSLAACEPLRQPSTVCLNTT